MEKAKVTTRLPNLKFLPVHDVTLKKHRKTVLLTGARGRLASELRRTLPSDLIEIIPFSRTRGDGIFSIDDFLTLGGWGNAEAIIHAAWSTVPMLSESNIGVEWRHDFPLLVELLKSVASRTPKPHFIFCSSGGSVYGNARSWPSRETDLLCPIGWHGFAKTQAEKLIQEFCAKTDTPYTILRISNPYGFPASSEKPQGIIPILIQAASRDERLHVWGDGTAKKDFIHVRDVVVAIREIISNQVVGVFNLSYGTSHNINSIIQKLRELLGRSLPVDYSACYPWDVTDSRLDNSKLRAAINWKPDIPIDHGLKMFLESLRAPSIRP